MLQLGCGLRHGAVGACACCNTADVMPALSALSAAVELLRHFADCFPSDDFLCSVDLVLVGAEAVVENGGVINKLGTYQVCFVAL